MRLMSRGNPGVLWNSASTAQGSNKGSSQAGQTQAVGEVVVELVAVESVEVVAHDEALGERFVHGHGEAAAQLGEADEQQAQAVFGVHGEVRQQAKFFEDIVAQVLGLVDDEHGELLGLAHPPGDLGADGAVEHKGLGEGDIL